MALSQRLELKQSQSLVMTPQLMQAIKLLQLGSLDLVAYVEAELERNPLLERDEADERPIVDPHASNADREPENAESRDLASSSVDTDTAGDGFADAFAGETATDWTEPSFERATAMTETIEADMTNVFPDDAPGDARVNATERPIDTGLMAGDSWANAGARGNSGDDYNLESFVAAEISLADHLANQLMLAISDPTRRLIGQFLIDAVDEAGYLRTDLASIAEKLGCAVLMVEEVLGILQTFDPAGVCARDLKECIALQLKERNRFDPAMRMLVDHLDLLARRDFTQLKRLCGIDDEDLVEMVGEIKALNPKPGNAFGTTILQPVVPDVLVKASADGGWLIELNTETLPRVLVNQSYYATVSKTAKGDKDKQYLSECLQTANWLVKSLDQRAKTILKVATEIVRQQDAFLVHGVQHLRPLNLRMIADAIGMHESTVSRVTSNKYMATKRGIFEFKYFFTSSIASSEGGEAHSSESVRHRIKELIDAESPGEVLSDDTLVKMLRDSGVDIARRTVAKYREAMHISSSVQRRREKQVMA
jgi:RNA polymerase sigma-54 factor